jgi:hypothetical protein
MRGMDLWILAMISFILFLSHILPNPKDTHKEVSSSHSDIVIYHWITQVSSSQTPTDVVFYMLLIL